MDYLEPFISTLHPSDPASPAVSGYFEWQNKHRTKDFVPCADDDIDLRTYFLNLHANGMDMNAIKEIAAALQSYYRWALIEGVITKNPFDEYDLLQPITGMDHIEKIQQASISDLIDLDEEKLRALHQIVEQLISSVDIQSALNSTLSTLLEVMHLKAGWVSMHSEYLQGLTTYGDPPPHGFVLAAACGLPPGLERDNRRFLRQPPACRCQALLIESRLTQPINIVECTRLRDSFDHEGDNQGLRFHATVPLISNGKPLGLINVAASEWQMLTQEDLHFLSTVSTRLVAALERAHYYEVAESRRILLEKELVIAGEVQAGLMPASLPEIPGYDLAYVWQPARGIAGDFYNIFPLNDGRWGILIGDVADKGAAAAMYMAMVNSLILAGALRSRSPAAVLNEVNQTLLRQAVSLIYVTVFLAVIDPIDHSMRYANAGHNPPIVRSAGGRLVQLKNTGSVLGVFDDLQLGEESITLNSGDAVLLYTDGVTEAFHSSNRDDEYGPERLSASFSAASGKARELLSQIEADFRAFTDDEPLMDDVTLMVLKKG